MKRTVAAILLLALALTLCACGSRTNTASAPAPAQEGPAQAEEPAPTEEPAPDPAEKLAEAKALLQSGDYEQALALLRELDADGVPGAAAALGKCLYLGLGCEVDYDRAVEAAWSIGVRRYVTEFWYQPDGETPEYVCRRFRALLDRQV